MAPTIHESLHEYIQFHRGRTQVQDTATVQADDAMGRFKMAVNVDRLIHVELAIKSPAQRMECVMCVFRPETGKDNALMICNSITVGIFEVEQFRALPDVRPAISRDYR